MDPALIPQWWGPRRLTTVVDQMDVRPGGLWRFLHRDAEGNEYAFHGEYRDSYDLPTRREWSRPSSLKGCRAMWRWKRDAG